ncbi:GtrA family protein [Polycyclovorans algicola]|uniref:GtrA family protein n=1 Tax=Polycyclovorans algicola TaxID=616992 RepID=UPI000693C1ED|nr:GtrA family protein [Polycyclovorans algicola]
MSALRGFLSVGVASTALHYALMTTAVELLGSPEIPAAAAGFLAGAALNYGLNRRLSFASKRPHRQGLPRFALMVALGVLLNSALLGLGLRLGLHYLPAQMLATVAVMGFNFACMKYWIFTVIEPERRG